MPELPSWAKPINQTSKVPDWAKPIGQERSQEPELRTAPDPSFWDAVKSFFSDPEKESAKAVQALVDSEALGVRPSVAYEYQDMIDRGVKMNPQAMSLRTTLGDRVKQSWDTGLKQNDMGEIGYQYIVSGDPKKLEQMQSIKMPTAEETPISKSRLEDAVRSAAKMLPMMVDTAVESTSKGLTVGMGFGGIAAILGQAGPQVATPEEVVTVPLATLLGFKIGATEGAFESSLRKEAGLALSEIINLSDSEGNKIDPNLARATAFGIGTLNGAIEVAQLRQVINTIPGLRNILSDSIMQAATNKTVINQLAELAKQYAKTVATETGQEVAQESVNIVFEEISKSVSREIEGTDIQSSDANDILNRLKDTMIESAKAFSVISLPGNVAQAAGIRGVKQTEEATQPEIVQQEQTPEEIKTSIEEESQVDDADVDYIINAEEDHLDAVIDEIINKIDKEETRLDTFRNQAAEVVPGQEDAIVSLVEARANAVGMTADEYLGYHNLSIMQGEGDQNKASVLFDENKTIITAFESADISSLSHELGHVFRRDLGGEELAIAEEWAGVNNGVWTEAAEEKFARGFERYLADGQAPTEELKTVFEQFKSWLLEIYQSITGSSIDVQLTPEIKGLFDSLLSSQQNTFAQRSDESYVYRFKGDALGDEFTQWADNRDNISHFGDVEWRVKESDLMPIDEFIAIAKPIILRLYEKSRLPLEAQEMIDEYGIDEVLNSLNPDDIVDSANGWDWNSPLSESLNDYVILPNEIAGVKTSDGAIVFDNSIAERVDSLYQRQEPTKTRIRRITGQRSSREISAMREFYRNQRSAAESGFRAGIEEGIARSNETTPESVKTRIRRITSQTDTSGPVTERQALKAAMKKAAQAARVAMREGRKEGVDVERARLKKLIADATKRRKTRESVKSIKAKIKKELKSTRVKKQSGKPVGKFTPEIQQTLDTLRMVSKLKPEQAEARIAENLDRYQDELPPPEVVIENHLLEMVARLDSMSDPESLQNLLDDIRALKSEGRAIRSIKAMDRAQRNRDAVENTIEELGGIPENLRSVGVKEFTTKSRSERSKRFLHTIGKTIVGWDDIMDILSFKSKTKPGESFISKNNDLLGVKNKEKRGTRIAMNDVNRIYQEAYGLKSSRQMLKQIYSDNTESIRFEAMPFVDEEGNLNPSTVTFTRSELRKRAMELMDDSLADTFEKMGYSERVRSMIFEALTPQDKQFIAAQMEFYRQYYSGVNDVYKEMYGVFLPQNDNYSPIQREGVSKPVDSGLGEFTKEMSFRASAATAGSLKSRVSNTNTISKQSDIAVLQRHIVEMEHFKAWGEKIRDLNAVWKNPNVRAAVQINHGRDTLAIVDSFISDFARGGIDTSRNLNSIDKFRINFTRAALGVSPDIFIKQLTSFVAYAEKMPLSQFMKYHAQFWLHPIENMNEIMNNSELMKERGQNIDRDLKAAMQTEEYSAFTKHQSFINGLLVNVKLGDRGGIILGGWPYYKWLVEEKGYTKQQAITAFEKFTEQTQQSGDITEQSFWQRGGSLAKIMTMFMSSPNQYLRKEIAALRNFYVGRQGIGQTVKSLMIYHFFLPMLFQLASDRFTWDEDEQKRALIFGPLNGWFIVGDGLDFLLRKALGMQQFDMEIPVYSVVHDLIKATDLINLFDLTEEEFLRAIRGLSGAIGDFTGLPMKQAIDALKGGKDVLDGEYEKGLTELMGYSPYQAEKLAND